MKTRIPDETLKGWLHPSERPLAWLAMIGIAPVALLVLGIVVLSYGVVALVIAAGIWFGGRMVEARLRGGAVEVNEGNFPEIAAQLRDVQRYLGYDKPIRAFVIQDGDINATLWRVFGRRYLSFNTGLVGSMSDREREFIIARFVGALRARHLRFHEAAGFIGGMEKLWVLNILVLPYIRSAVFSGDRIGMMACGDADTAMSALDKFLLGGDLSGRLSLEGFLRQGRAFRESIFRLFSITFSSHPHMTDRYLELAAFASEQELAISRWPMPELKSGGQLPEKPLPSGLA